ncbi:succinylglutamate desuccinylase/aspartoacylase family protein [Opitutaceae bacterium]|nr:succinylglutamate desuccinylase/aspartoacylase family protein [Opitutaceae bacterium]
MTTDPSSQHTPDWTTLPTGLHAIRFGTTEVGFDAWIWRGEPGPTLVINAATHGDEYEGPTLLRRWIDSWQPENLCGTVMLIPVLNEAAFAAKQRCQPADNGNLARAFPGDAHGSPTARLAHLFDTQILAHTTHYIDLHSGGHVLELHPWVGYITGDNPERDAVQHRMAACFDAFWGWAGPFLPGRTLSAAFERNIPAIYAECRGAGEIRDDDLAALDRGLHNVLIELGSVEGTEPTLAAQKFHYSTEAEETHLQAHHPAPHDGTFEPVVALRDEVEAGAKLGTVRSPTDDTITPIYAESSGTVVLLRHDRSVQSGNALCVIVPL